MKIKKLTDPCSVASVEFGAKKGLGINPAFFRQSVERFRFLSRWLLVVFLLPAFLFCQDKEPRSGTTKRKARTQSYLETGGLRKLDVVYKQVGGKDLKLDLYYPTQKDKTPASSPVVIYTHGGGWAAGSKLGASRGSLKTVFLMLLEKGFAVASVDYRLCKKANGVTIRDCVIDCKDAMRFLAKNSESLGLDRHRFFVMGDSAGGHLAQMQLLTSTDSFPGDENLAKSNNQVLAGVSWYGPSDFEKMELFNHDDRANFKDRFANRILGADQSNKQNRYREISPINYLNSKSPPLLMIQGDRDTTIPVKHAFHMKKKADKISAPVEIMIIKNSGHNWRKVENEIDPSREAIIQRTVQFFVDHRQTQGKNEKTN